METYLAAPRTADLEGLATRARSAAQLDPSIRHLGSVVLAADEICFHVFSAPSAGALRQASRQAELPHDRIVEAIWIPAGTGGD